VRKWTKRTGEGQEEGGGISMKTTGWRGWGSHYVEYYGSYYGDVMGGGGIEDHGSRIEGKKGSKRLKTGLNGYKSVSLV